MCVGCVADGVVTGATRLKLLEPFVDGFDGLVDFVDGARVAGEVAAGEVAAGETCGVAAFAGPSTARCATSASDATALSPSTARLMRRARRSTGFMKKILSRRTASIFPAQLLNPVRTSYGHATTFCRVTAGRRPASRHLRASRHRSSRTALTPRLVAPEWFARGQLW